MTAGASERPKHLRTHLLRRKRNNNQELAKNEVFPYKKGGTFPHSQKWPELETLLARGRLERQKTQGKGRQDGREQDARWRSEIADSWYEKSVRSEESGHGHCATNGQSPQSSGDVCTDTEQTKAALPIEKMVISSHLAAKKHFLFHSSVLLSNEARAAAAVSRQTPRSAGAGPGSGASLPRGGRDGIVSVSTRDRGVAKGSVAQPARARPRAGLCPSRGVPADKHIPKTHSCQAWTQPPQAPVI